MAEYDLGTAHGKVVIEYDGKGGDDAKRHMGEIGNESDKLDGRVKKMAASVTGVFQRIVSGTTGVLSSFTGLSKGGLLLGGVTAGLVGLNGGVMNLGRNVGIIGNLATAFGFLPRSISGFPNILQNIVRISAGIAVFRGSIGILGSLAGRFTALGFVSRLLGGIGSSTEGLARIFQRFASVILLVGSAMASMKIAMNIAKVMGMAVAAIGAGVAAFHAIAIAAGGAIQVLGGLASMVKTMSGAFLILPAAIGAVALVVGTFKIGMSNMGDAMKAVAGGDAKALDEALKKLAPSARAVVLAVKDMQPAWKAIKLDVQQRMFAGLAFTIQDLGGKYLPILRRELGNVADTINFTAAEIGRFFRQKSTVSEFSSMVNNLENAWENVSAALLPVVQGLFNIAKAGSKVFLELSHGAEDVGNAFLDWTINTDLEKKIRDGINAVRDLWAILKNVGAILVDIFTGYNGNRGPADFLKSMRDGTQAARDFLESVKGKGELKKFADFVGGSLNSAMEIFRALWDALAPTVKALLPVFNNIGSDLKDGLLAVLHELGPTLEELVPVFKELYDWLKWKITESIKFLTPIFKGLVDLIVFLGPVLAPIIGTLAGFGVSAMGLGLALKILSPLITLVTLGITTLIKTVQLVAGIWHFISDGSALALLTTIKNVTLIVAQWIWMKVRALAEAIAAGAAWLWINGIAAVQAIATMTANAVLWVAQWIWMKIRALAEALLAAGAWLLLNVPGLQAIITMTANAVLFVAQWIWMKLRMLAEAAGAAFAWLVMTGPEMIASLATMVANALLFVAQWVIMKLGILAEAIGAAFAWLILTGPEMIASLATMVANVILFIAQWVLMKLRALEEAILTAAAWLIIVGPEMATALAAMVVGAAAFIAEWVAMKARALAEALLTAGAWLIMVGTEMATAIAAAIVAFATVVAGWVAMAAGAVADAAIIAAAWLVAIGPIALVLAAIAGLVAALVWCYENVAWFRDACNTAWKAISDGAGAMHTEIVNELTPIKGDLDRLMANPIEEMKRVVGEQLNAVIQFFADLPGKIRAQLAGWAADLQNSGQRAVDGLVSGVQTVGSRIGNAIMDAAGDAWNRFASWTNSLWKLGQWIVDGIVNGIRNSGNAIQNTLMQFAENAWNAVKNYFGISSPSKLMRDTIGKQLPAGVAVGIKSAASQAVEAALSMARRVSEAAQIDLPSITPPGVNDLVATATAAANRAAQGYVVQANGSVVGSAGASAATARQQVADTVSAATEAVGTTIQQLTLQIAGNLDPTDELKFREAIKMITEGIRKAEKAAKQGSTV